MTTYIEFIDCGVPEGKKTTTWDIYNKTNKSYLGSIRWFNHWRKYCFYPESATVFEEVCLGDIAQFIKEKTKEYKN